MNQYNLRKKLSKLRKSLSQKGFGTEIKPHLNKFFLVIKTVEPTGFFSKKEIKEQIEINPSFLNLSDFQKEKKLLEKINDARKTK